MNIRQSLSTALVSTAVALAALAAGPTTTPTTGPTTRTGLPTTRAGLPTTGPLLGGLSAARPTLDPNQRRLRLLTSKAIRQMEDKQFDECRDSLTRALKIDPNEPTDLYNMACLDALTGHPESAVDFLERSAMAGFDDFAHISADPDLKSIRDLPDYKSLISRKTYFQHKAAERVFAALKQQFGDKYIYEIDDDDKFIFATNTDPKTLAALKHMLISQAKSQWKTLFAHKPEGYLSIVLPSPNDYAKLRPNRNVLGFYNPGNHTLITSGLGFVTTHEFTHALHYGDIEQMNQEHPIWLIEGIAVLFEHTEYKGDVLTPEANFRLYELQMLQQAGALLPIAKLLKMDHQTFIDDAGRCYAESGGIIAYLYEKGLLRQFYDAVKANYEKDKTGRVAIEQVTKQSLPAFEKDWKAWLEKATPPPMYTGPKGAYIGVKFGTANDGILIDDVVAGGPAEKAGMKKGDLIVGLNDVDVRERESMVPMLAIHKPGETVTFNLRRGTDYLSLPVVLGVRPDDQNPTTRPARGTTRPSTRPSRLLTTRPTTRP